MIPNIKKRALHRSKIIEGQVKGITKAIEDETYCIDILNQSLSIQKALKSLDGLILENHLRTHVKNSIKNKKNRDKSVKELLKLYTLSNE